MSNSPKLVDTKASGPENYNPLIADQDGETMQRVSCVLQYLQSHVFDTEDNLDTDESNYRYGRILIHDVLIQALRRRKVQS